MKSATFNCDCLSKIGDNVVPKNMNTFMDRESGGLVTKIWMPFMADNKEQRAFITHCPFCGKKFKEEER